MTGSTGGIGLETVRLLVAEGARVVTCGRRDAPGVGEVAHVVADLSQPGEPERVVAEATRELSGLDVLVNNVGIARQASFEEVPDEEWDAYWQLNVMSYVRAIRAALPSLRQTRGAIVNVSSTAGKRPSTGMPHYSVTKAAVLSLSGSSPTSTRATESAAMPSPRGQPRPMRGSAREGSQTSRATGRRYSRRSERGGRSAGLPARKRSPP